MEVEYIFASFRGICGGFLWWSGLVTNHIYHEAVKLNNFFINSLFIMLLLLFLVGYIIRSSKISQSNVFLFLICFWMLNMYVGEHLIFSLSYDDFPKFEAENNFHIAILTDPQIIDKYTYDHIPQGKKKKKRKKIEIFSFLFFSF